MLRESTTAIFSLLLLFCGSTVQARQHPVHPVPLYTGEKLTYSMEYLSMELARVHLEVIGRVDTLGANLHRVRTRITSNPNVPFIMLNESFESYFDDNFNCYSYTGSGITRKFAYRLEYAYDAQSNAYTAIEYRRRGKVEEEHKRISDTRQADIRDGLTLFYYLRSRSKHRGDAKRIEIPVLIGMQQQPVEFKTASRLQQVETLDRTFSAIPASVKLGFKGLGGIKDKIELTYSADEYAIPLSGVIRFPLGKVKIRLVEFVPGRPENLQTSAAALRTD